MTKTSSILFSLLLMTLLIAVVMSSGCTRATPSATAATVLPKTSPTVAFRVELPISPTPTQASVSGTPLPSPTPGPTKTPRPTKTPWPTEAPTSAPANDPNMVYVPGGPFIFGSDSGHEDETPRQTIEIDSFNIDIHPVTNAEYQAFVQATGHQAPRHWKDGQIPTGKENHPVVWVTWEDANAYCTWAGKRLPKEMEWEKAARGEEGRIYPWGNEFDSSRCNSNQSDTRDTSPVDQFPNGASPYGVLDMAGNVWEWTADWYQPYRGSIYQIDKYGETHKVLRGGSWYDGPELLRSSARYPVKPSFKFSTVGFRCVK